MHLQKQGRDQIAKGAYRTGASLEKGITEQPQARGNRGFRTTALLKTQKGTTEQGCPRKRGLANRPSEGQKGTREQIAIKTYRLHKRGVQISCNSLSKILPGKPSEDFNV